VSQLQQEKSELQAQLKPAPTPEDITAVLFPYEHIPKLRHSKFPPDEES